MVCALLWHTGSARHGIGSHRARVPLSVALTKAVAS